MMLLEDVFLSQTVSGMPILAGLERSEGIARQVVSEDTLVQAGNYLTFIN